MSENDSKCSQQTATQPKGKHIRVQGVYIHINVCDGSLLQLHLRKEREVVDLSAYVMDVQRRTVGIASTV